MAETNNLGAPGVAAGDGGAADARLLDAVRRGDPAAFGVFVERFGPVILGFGLRMCGHREDAEDVLQETLVKAFTKLKSLEAPEALRTWLWRVVANECRMSRRGPRDPSRAVALDAAGGDEGRGGLQLADQQPGPEESLARAEDKARVEQALRELGPEQRMIILLRDFEGLSTSEVAEVLGITEANAKVRLHRARLALRDRLMGPVRSEGELP